MKTHKNRKLSLQRLGAIFLLGSLFGLLMILSSGAPVVFADGTPQQPVYVPWSDVERIALHPSR